MLELLSKLKSDELLAVVIITALAACALMMGLSKIIADSLRRYHERQLATSLMLEMLDRGMPTDDILRILSAAGLQGHQGKRSAWRERLANRLRQKLARHPTPETTNPTRGV